MKFVTKSMILDMIFIISSTTPAGRDILCLLIKRKPPLLTPTTTEIEGVCVCSCDGDARQQEESKISGFMVHLIVYKPRLI